jgi:hypothetical protein
LQFRHFEQTSQNSTSCRADQGRFPQGPDRISHSPKHILLQQELKNVKRLMAQRLLRIKTNVYVQIPAESVSFARCANLL